MRTCEVKAHRLLYDFMAHALSVLEILREQDGGSQGLEEGTTESMFTGSGEQIEKIKKVLEMMVLVAAQQGQVTCFL